MGRCQHDTERHPAIPFGLDLVQRSGQGVFDQFAQVGFQPHQDRLCFRIAQTAVEFNRLDRTILADHQSGIKETSVGRPFGRHAAHRRQNDFTHCLGVQFRRHHRRG